MEQSLYLRLSVLDLRLEGIQFLRPCSEFIPFVNEVLEGIPCLCLEVFLKFLI